MDDNIWLTILPSRKCSLTMTMFTVLASLKVRKPKPRERPVLPSRITVHSITSPNCSKYSRSDSIESSPLELPGPVRFVSGQESATNSPSVVSQFKPPINIFLLIYCQLLFHFSHVCMYEQLPRLNARCSPPPFETRSQWQRFGSVDQGLLWPSREMEATSSLMHRAGQSGVAGRAYASASGCAWCGRKSKHRDATLQSSPASQEALHGSGAV